jgi:CRISPR/Cas system-associated protein Cas10 (large subunit of type III CRISPR-Cas system)
MPLIRLTRLLIERGGGKFGNGLNKFTIMKKAYGYVNRTATLKRRNATIRSQKREIKYLLKVIEQIEQEKKEDISSLISDKNKIVSELQSKLSTTEAQLKESLKKKWYQFQQVNGYTPTL